MPETHPDDALIACISAHAREKYNYAATTTVRVDDRGQVYAGSDYVGRIRHVGTRMTDLTLDRYPEDAETVRIGW